MYIYELKSQEKIKKLIGKATKGKKSIEVFKESPKRQKNRRDNTNQPFAYKEELCKVVEKKTGETIQINRPFTYSRRDNI